MSKIQTSKNWPIRNTSIIELIRSCSDTYGNARSLLHGREHAETHHEECDQPEDGHDDEYRAGRLEQAGAVEAPVHVQGRVAQDDRAENQQQEALALEISRHWIHQSLMDFTGTFTCLDYGLGDEEIYSKPVEDFGVDGYILTTSFMILVFSTS